ncbi:hypothetical protein [Mesorhizobium sp. 131-2-1]|jgi:hypothetical protein|uniref:hypothetical protein n=1 Tax=Mesorhizobium sp. 131-2-1 TaxID=2744518 RepID=UPI001927A7A6|nr:hypothetical protein [Mesorhizobium sp. 131-2-1]BCG92527.1 hypothetical protein MesoLj131a_13910 [Mesorhizobium sp. 131-2-1]
MSKIIPAENARQGRGGSNVLKILVAALLLAFIASGVAEIYGEVIKAPITEQRPKS